ncbi:MAG: RcnB family protein [Caulobacterales bacterium]
MRRPLAMTAIAAGLALAATCALADPHHDRGGGDRGGGDRGGPPHEERGGYRGGFGAERGGGDRRGGWRGEMRGPPAERPNSWDDRRYNGYWMGNRWSYGPPPGNYQHAPGYRPGRAQWRIGTYLPPYYRNFGVGEYWLYHLRRPPYGYYWVRVGDDFMLVAEGSGLIFDIIGAGE